MDDNELENEREKREHELDLAKLARQRTGWEAFWDMLNENFMWVFFIVLAIIAAIVQVKTGHEVKGLF